MRPGRIVALVVGIMLIVPGLGMLFGGGALGLGYAVGRDGDGYFESTLERLSTDTVAITTEDITLDADPDSAEWIFDRLDVEIRLRATSADPDQAVFIGIGPRDDVRAYLEGVAHDEIVELDNGNAVYERRPGTDLIDPPSEQTFWDVSAGGSGTQELIWEPSNGHWAVVLMNADGSTDVIAEVNLGAKAGFVAPLAVILTVVGAAVTAVGLGLIIFGALGARRPVVPGTPTPAQ
jgi:hypothetical protein